MANKNATSAAELDLDEEELFATKPRCKKMYPNCPWANYTSKGLGFGTDVGEDVENFESHIEEGCAGVTSARHHKFVFSAEQKQHIGLAQKVTCNVVGKRDAAVGGEHEKHFKQYEDYAGVKSGGDHARRKGAGQVGEQKKTALVRQDAVAKVMGRNQQSEKFNYEEFMDDFGDGAAGMRSSQEVAGNDQVLQVTGQSRSHCGTPTATSAVDKTLHNRRSIAPNLDSRNRWLKDNFKDAAGMPAGGEKRYHSKPAYQTSSMVSHVVFGDEPPDFDNEATIYDDSFGAPSGAVLYKSMPHLYTANPTPNQFSNPMKNQRQSVAMAMDMSAAGDAQKPQVRRNKAMLPW